jgi:UDP-N-acetylglucosamine transferase subunit ALG13
MVGEQARILPSVSWIANVLNSHALEGRILLLCRRSKRQLFVVRQLLMDTVLLLELSY